MYVINVGVILKILSFCGFPQNVFSAVLVTIQVVSANSLTNLILKNADFLLTLVI